jgi:hypothetical protein
LFTNIRRSIKMISIYNDVLCWIDDGGNCCGDVAGEEVKMVVEILVDITLEIVGRFWWRFHFSYVIRNKFYSIFIY